jgi:hypothetical protein
MDVPMRQVNDGPQAGRRWLKNRLTRSMLAMTPMNALIYVPGNASASNVGMYARSLLVQAEPGDQNTEYRARWWLLLVFDSMPGHVFMTFSRGNLNVVIALCCPTNRSRAYAEAAFSTKGQTSAQHTPVRRNLSYKPVLCLNYYPVPC